MREIILLKATLPNIEEKVMRAKAAIKSDVDARLAQIDEEKRPFTDRLNTLTTEESRINTELTMAR